METLRPAAEAKSVELRLDLDPSVEAVWGDADRLQQVVWNLLANAVKYTPQGGRVETQLKGEGKSATIIVRAQPAAPAETPKMNIVLFIEKCSVQIGVDNCLAILPHNSMIFSVTFPYPPRPAPSVLQRLALSVSCISI
jgi:hypothetical protein